MQPRRAPRRAVLLAVMCILWATFSVRADAAAGETVLRSPDGKVEFTLFTGAAAPLAYSVRLNGNTLIERSPLGMVVDGANLAEGARIGKIARYKVKETYPWHGVHATAVNRCSAANIQARHAATGTAYTVEARACDDGVAFRYLVPGAEGKTRVPDEATAFRIPAASTVWFHDFEGHYEGVHQKKTIEDVKEGEWAAPPLTFRLPGKAGYGSISEGGLRHYPGLGLQADGRRGFIARLGHAHPVSYPFRLRYKEDVERLAKPASIEGVITTPWRVVMVGADLNALVNSDIVHNVAAPPDLKLFPEGLKTPWIRPGRAVWKYLDGGENTFAEMKEFSRLAGELGFEYNVIEGFWQRWTPEQLRELVKYSRERGVGVILWKHSKELRTPEARRKFFDICRDAGVAGAKIDFFDHEAKEIVELYEACLRDAAAAHMVLDFHGANKPAGESRTFPNELTREAIRGMEARRQVRATHGATLPFTRMLAGHADYTPMVFSERRNDTTWAHQIASAAIFTSPLLVFGAHPHSMLDNPAVDIIKSIPSVWDETIALPVSEIGEVAAFARQRQGVWFVAIMNGAAARSVEIPLSFLGGGTYDAVLVRDSAQGPAAVEIQKGAMSRDKAVRVDLQPGGGFIGRFVKAAGR